MREQSWFRGSGPYLLGFFISLLSAIKRSSSKIKKKTTSVGFDLSTQTLDTRPESAPPRLSAPPPLAAAGAHAGPGLLGTAPPRTPPSRVPAVDRGFASQALRVPGDHALPQRTGCIKDQSRRDLGLLPRAATRLQLTAQ